MCHTLLWLGCSNQVQKRPTGSSEDLHSPFRLAICFYNFGPVLYLTNIYSTRQRLWRRFCTLHTSREEAIEYKDRDRPQGLPNQRYTLIK